MHLTAAAAALLSCTAVQAFSNTTPFVLFSTSEIPSVSLPTDAQLQTSGHVLSSVKQILASCPTQYYLLISQPNLHATDIRGANGQCQAPNLCQAVAVGKHAGQFHVAEVVGQITSDSLAEYVKGVCSGKGKNVDVQAVEMKHLPSAKEPAKRAALLSENDREVGMLLETLDSDYTVLLFSDPNDGKPYEADFGDAVHMDLKRGNLMTFAEKGKGNSTSLPLFEKYQFFTPGIFMSLITAIILFSILGVGLSALSSLKVPYGAFDKEMGPAAQKK